MAKSGLIHQDALFHDRYRIVRCIKAGGMGAVYEVLDERTNSRRALKAMLPGIVDDADLRARFEREARVTGSIESDHILRVSDVGVDDATGTPFMVMDLLRGRDLGYVVDEVRPLSREDVVLYLTQVALALDKTHAAGIVHRDLKPENLFLTSRDDGSRCLKILDFGIAKVLERRTQAKSTRTIGTPAYMAPEQIRGEATVGPAADIYALGHIAYALLVGIDYWAEESSQISSTFGFFTRVLLGMSEGPSTRARRQRGIELPAAFDVWLFRAAALLPEERYASASACIVALADALDLATPPALAHVPIPEPLISRASSAPTVSHSAPTLPEPSAPIAFPQRPVAREETPRSEVGLGVGAKPATPPISLEEGPSPRVVQRDAETAPTPTPARSAQATSAPVTIAPFAASMADPDPAGPDDAPEPEVRIPVKRRAPVIAAVAMALVGALVGFGVMGSGSSPHTSASPGIANAPSVGMALSATATTISVEPASALPSVQATTSAIAPAVSASAPKAATARPSMPSAPRPPTKPTATPKPAAQPHGLL